MTGIFIRERSWRFGHRDTDDTVTDKGHVMIKEEIAVMQLQSKEHQGLPGAPRS